MGFCENPDFSLYGLDGLQEAIPLEGFAITARGYQLKAKRKACVRDVSISTSNKKLCGRAQSHVS
jgi:hypothetical protein